MTGGTCSCGNSLGKRNKSGRCRPCVARALNADPVHRAKRIAATKAMHATPERRRLNQQLARQNAFTYWRSPEGIERRRHLGREQYAHLTTPEMRERCRIARADATRCRYARQFAWLPPERRDEYNRLVRSKRMKAADAKALILADMARNGRPKTFAEKLALVEQGKASLVPAMPRLHLEPRIAA